MILKYLDGIKGICALGVFLCHYQMLNFPSPSWFHTSFFADWFMNGGLSVALFLIISGFSAWQSVQRKLENEKDISKALVKRYFRFAVPFGIVYIILYLTYYCGLYTYHTDAGKLLNSDILSAAFWPVSLMGFIKSLIVSPFCSDFWDSPLWMMKYVFLSPYIAFSLAVMTRPLSKYRALVLLIISLILLSFWDIFLLGLTIGYIISFLYDERGIFMSKLTKTSTKFYGVFFLFAGILCFYFIKGSTEFVNFSTGAFLMLSIFLLPLLKIILESRFFQYLGKISFGIYLWHWPILCSLTSFLVVQSYDMDSLASFAFTFIPTIVTVFIISHLSERLIETRISEYIIKKIMKVIYK